MNSEYFKILETEINGLINGLLPTDEQIASPEYTDEDWQDEIKSFILLSHAAFEHYFEELAVFKCEEAIQKYLDTGQISNILLSLLLTYKIEWYVEIKQLSFYQKIKSIFCPKKYNTKGSTKNLSNAIKTSMSQSLTELCKLYKSDVIDKNLGCNKNNLFRLFTPLVLDKSIAHLDENLFSDIEAFTKKRGYYAHKCSSFWAAKPIGIHPVITVESARDWKSKIQNFLHNSTDFNLKNFDETIFCLDS